MVRRALLIASIVGACGFPGDCSPQPSNVIRIGVDNAAPYHTIRPDGSVEGLAVDVFNKAAALRKITIVWVPLPNGGTLRELRDGKIDAWPAVSRTPARDQLFHFTKPWIESNYYLLTRSGSGITLDHSYGIRLSVAGYQRIQIVAAQLFPHSALATGKNHIAALQEFCAGRADAALLDARSLDGILLERPEGCGSVPIHLEFLPAASNPVSIASTLAKAALADSLQKGIMQVAGNGEMWAAIDKWSGFSAAQTRSFFALREVEGRRDLYLFGFTVVTLFVFVFVWIATRLRMAQSNTKAAQRSAANSESRFQAFMDHSPLVGYIKDEGGRMLYMNQRFVNIFGRSREDCIGKDDFELWPQETAAVLRRNDLSILNSGRIMEFVETAPVNGEDTTWLSLKFPFQQGARTFLGGMSIDITERERAKEALRLSEERFRSLFSHATVGIGICAPSGKIIRVNDALCRILRMDEGACLRESVQTLFDESAFDKAATGATFETKHERCGTALWTENCLFSVTNTAGEAVNLVVIVEDVTQRKIAEAQLAYQARHDLLTGLPNRRVHESFLEDKIAEAREYRRKVCLLYVDLDDFKIVNDTMGHDAGDILLQEAAKRLRSLVSEENSLSRMGGDEFVLVQIVGDRDEAQALSVRLRLAMEQPFAIRGRDVALRASAGFSVFPEDGQDARTLRKKADDAMYLAKRTEKRNRRNPTVLPSREFGVLSALR